MDALIRRSAPIARVVLGLVFLTFGLNWFVPFLPVPPHPARGHALMTALAAAGYFMPLLKGTEIVVGALLLVGRFVPLALVVIAPVIVQIAAFHLFLAPANLAFVALLVVAALIVARANWPAFAPLVSRSAPAPAWRSAPSTEYARG
jgi:hypothetical protein